MQYYKYLHSEKAELFTVVCLPEANGSFPTVIFRSPYVDEYSNMVEDEIVAQVMNKNNKWLEKGYAVVFQHCRGRGKSSGDCVPYIYEREDGLNLQEWIRNQPFYNGELYLFGGSYTSSVHFVTSPFAEDIKGAIFLAQDCERYNCNYRNGFYKIGLHGGWYVNMYKKKSIPVKNFKNETFNMLPLIDFSKTVFGEKAEDFDQILLHPNKKDEFWNTRLGGGEAHDAIKNANIPILLVTGFYDIYTGGIFDMWNGLGTETKSKCVLLVHPYDHGNIANGQPVKFENGSTSEEFGDFDVKWFEHIRGKQKAPFKKGEVTYYKVFGDKWCTDDFKTPENQLNFSLGDGERTYVYNPYAPASFNGGLSTNFGGSAWQDAPNSRYDIISFFTPEFSKDTFVKGKMKAKLRVKSNCEDTCFYIRLSLMKKEGYYGLRDDINQISNFCDNYVPGKEIDMEFTFDEHAFVIHKGEKIRVDISSSAFPLYVRHTNNNGLYSLQTTAKIAKNTIVCNKSNITLFVE